MSPETLDPRRQTLDAAAERRQLTVMSVTGRSTALSEQLDPEEYREVVRAINKLVQPPLNALTVYCAISRRRTPGVFRVSPGA